MFIDIEALLEDVPHRTLILRRGMSVYLAGDAAECGYVVKRGCIRLQVDGEDGVRQIVAFLFPQDIFGFEFGIHGLSAETASDAVLRRYPIGAVISASKDRSEISTELLEHANGLAAGMARHVQKIAHQSAAERVLWFFDQLAASMDPLAEAEALELPMSHRDVGDYLGLNPETMSRTVKMLAAEGRLARAGRKIIIFRSTRTDDGVETRSASTRSSREKADRCVAGMVGRSPAPPAWRGRPI